VVLWAATTLTFLIIRLVPGDAVDVLAATLPDPRQQAAVRAQWGLSCPLWARYATFMGGLVHGDLGVSLTSGVPVSTLLAGRFPATIELAVVAMLLTAFLGIGLGVVAAAAHNSWLDYASRGLALLGFAVPWFWFALMLIALFAVQLPWSPVSGRLSPLIARAERVR
jgi:ABC-type dipeptide/oligopeptide/nickel transport system permease component